MWPEAVWHRSRPDRQGLTESGTRSATPSRQTIRLGIGWARGEMNMPCRWALWLSLAILPMHQSSRGAGGDSSERPDEPRMGGCDGEETSYDRRVSGRPGR